MSSYAVTSEFVSALVGLTVHFTCVVLVMAAFVPGIGILSTPNITLGISLLWFTSFFFPYLLGYTASRLLFYIVRIIFVQLINQSSEREKEYDHSSIV
jgi:hypothetical protein